MKNYVMVIDEGTTGTRALIFDRQFNIVSQAYTELHVYSYNDGICVEMDAQEIYDKSIEMCKEAMQKANIEPTEIECIGITNQRRTSMLWDKETQQALGRAITWQDSRTDPLSRRVLDDGWGDYLAKHAGRRAANASLFILKWLMENEPGVDEKVKNGEVLFGCIDTWLVYKMTKGKKHLASWDNSANSGWISMADLSWNEEMLKYLGIPREIFPEPVENAGDYGVTDKSIFGVEIPITGVIADQHSAMFAQRVVQPGMVKCTNGTGAFLNINAGHKSIIAPKLMMGWLLNGEPTYQMEGVVNTAGSAVKWLRDELGLFNSYDEIQGLVDSVEDTAGVMIVPCLAGITHPIEDNTARGTFLGISRATKKGNIMRAMLEGIAYSIKDIYVNTEKETGIKLGAVKMDGGLTNSTYYCQVAADILNAPVHRSALAEATALGAAEMAGLYAGVWAEKDFDDLAKVIEYNPRPEEVKKREEEYDIWQDAVGRARHWLR